MNPSVKRRNPQVSPSPQKVPPAAVKVPSKHANAVPCAIPDIDLWEPIDGVASLTLGEAFVKFGADYNRRDRSTLQRAEWWVAALGADTPLSKISSIQVRRILKAMEIADPTRNRYASALSSIYKYAQSEMEWEGDNPCISFAKWPEGHSKQTGLTVEEVERLLVACLTSSWPKLRLLVLMAVVTGMRRGSLEQLRYKDIGPDGTAQIGRTKNGTPFIAVLPGELQAELKRFATHANPEDLIFEGTKPGRPMVFDKQYKTACRRAGLANINFHTLRHTCASIIARAGASTIEIMEFLNHKTPAMAARYSHLNVEHRKRRAPEIFKGLAETTT